MVTNSSPHSVIHQIHHQICHHICHQIWWFTKFITKFGDKFVTKFVTKYLGNLHRLWVCFERWRWGWWCECQGGEAMMRPRWSSRWTSTIVKMMVGDWGWYRGVPTHLVKIWRHLGTPFSHPLAIPLIVRWYFSDIDILQNFRYIDRSAYRYTRVMRPRWC